VGDDVIWLVLGVLALTWASFRLGRTVGSVQTHRAWIREWNRRVRGQG
jgi:hypothetical protein